jgi:hypothetical protein
MEKAFEVRPDPIGETSVFVLSATFILGLVSKIISDLSSLIAYVIW